jgi:thiol-disulfide isomerase/thioredoxin
MLNWRSALGASLMLLTGTWAGCQSQTPPEGEPEAKSKANAKQVELEGVDTSQLTAREKKDWSKLVSELLAPCSDQPVSLAQCVTEKRSCDACQPAAEFLVRQVTTGKTRSQAEKAFRLRFSPEEVRSIELGNSPSKGPPSARVTVVEWADFECPFCGMAAPIMDEAVQAFPNDVRLVFKHYPLSGHEHSEAAARAAVAAGMQGKFWDMHHQLFTHQQELDDGGLLAHARAVGLDLKKFREDRKSEAAADIVSADRKQGNKMGIQGTPSIYINGRYFDLDLFDLKEDLQDWFKLEIQLTRGHTVAAAPSAGTTPVSATAGLAAPTPSTTPASDRSVPSANGPSAAAPSASAQPAPAAKTATTAAAATGG